MAKKLTELETHLVGFRRALAILDTPPLVTDRPVSYRLVNRKATSRSGESPSPILRRRQCCATSPFGPSGAGKSTIVNLLTRFHDPSACVVLPDGREMRDYRLTDLRDQFAIVPQDPQLFPTSIAENIRYGNLQATDGQVEANVPTSWCSAERRSFAGSITTDPSDRASQ